MLSPDDGAQLNFGCRGGFSCNSLSLAGSDTRPFSFLIFFLVVIPENVSSIPAVPSICNQYAFAYQVICFEAESRIFKSKYDANIVFRVII